MKKTNNQFKEFGLSDQLLDSLRLLKYLEPTKIQEQVIPVALKERDIVAKSQTGSGKTAAFSIPICQLVIWEKNQPQALVLEPTRELAVQVRDEIFHIGRNKRLKVPAVFGGFPIDKQTLTLKQKSHVVVGTPGRIMDHVTRKSIDLSQVKYLVIDEADLMLDMGFLEDVKEIIKELPEDKVIMLFSATIGDTINELIDTYLVNPVSIILESKTETVEEIEQVSYLVENEEKYQKLVTLLIQENPENCMIFCGTREMVNVLYRKLKKDKIRCGMLHGELDQQERLKTIEEFREERFHYLIATDVAARGVDFENITHVINYDFPTGKETYVHRIGRTGRNGKSGKAISLFGTHEIKMKQMIENYIEKEIPVASCPNPGELDEKKFWSNQKKKRQLKAGKGAVFHQTITRLSIGGGKKSKMRTVDIVGTICNIPGITAEDIGIIDIRESLTYVEILNGKGKKVLDVLQEKPIKGKVRKVRITRGQ